MKHTMKRISPEHYHQTMGAGHVEKVHLDVQNHLYGSQCEDLVAMEAYSAMLQREELEFDGVLTAEDEGQWPKGEKC
jgi:hypothetical protein